MSYIDWTQGAQQAATAYGTEAQNAQQQLEQTQRLRGLSALQGLNLNDPASLNSAIGGLARAGMIEQASALSGLYKTSAINQATVPLVQQEAAVESQQNQQPSATTGLGGETHIRLLTDANRAFEDILSSPEGSPERAQKAQHWGDVFRQEENGVPDAAVDGALSDLTNAGLQGHQANIQREIQKYTVENQPGYEGAAGALNRFAGKPVLTGALAGANLDPTTGLNLAANVTSPARNYGTQAAYGPQIAAATTAAENVAGANTAGAVRQTATAQSGGAQAGAAPFGAQEITLSDGSKIQAHAVVGPDGNVTWQQIQPTPAAAGGPPGAAPASSNPGFGATPSPQTQATYNASATQLAGDRAAASNSTAQLASLKDIDRLAPTTNTGPGTTVTNGWRQFLIAQAPWLAQHLPGFDLNAQQIQAADQNQIKKDMLRVATMAGDAVGGSGTDYRMAQAISGNANIDMSQLSVQQINRMTMGLMRALYAKAPAFDATHAQGQEGQYSKWAENYGLTVDPRAFILDVLKPAERKAITDGLGKPGSVAWQHFANGVVAAKRAGYYDPTDLPAQ